MVAPAYVLGYATTGMLAALTMLLAGCSRPVAVQAPDVTQECEPLLAAAPISVLGQLQRETTPANAAAIAWGDPPIVLACGVLVEVAPDAQVVEVDGVAWIAQSSDAGTVFTTADTSPTVQVRVPESYRPEIEALNELADVVGNSVDAVGVS